MQIINSELFTILVPDKGYKLVNKTTGTYHKKIYLGVNDSAENYGEVVDEKYINMDYVVELDNLKEISQKTLDNLLLAVDEIYTMVEPLLMMIPMTIPEKEGEPPLSNLIPFYAAIVERGLKSIEEVPDRYKKEVAALLEK